MKKIALLFTILCTSTLNSMENINYGHVVFWEKLKPNLKTFIINSINDYDTFIDIIYTIRATSVANKELNTLITTLYNPYNLKGFTTLIGTLLKKFPELTRENIANEFGTPIAKQYIRRHAKKLPHTSLYVLQNPIPTKILNSVLTSMISLPADLSVEALAKSEVLTKEDGSQANTKK